MKQRSHVLLLVLTSLGEASIALTHEEADDPLISQIPDKT